MPLERKLSFKDRYVLQIGEIVNESIDTDNLASFPDQTTPVLLHVTWTQAEYTRLLSALDVGAVLAYPYQSQQIYYDFLKVTNGSGMTCEDIIDCIESDAETKAALMQYLSDNGYTQNPASSGIATPSLPTTTTGENMLSGVTDCSNPATDMAIARAIVRELDESVNDVFQQIELVTNLNEAAGIIIGAIPAVGTGAKVLEMANWIQETVVETYQAAYTQNAEDVIGCAIFCHMQDTCSLSLDDLLSIYENLGSITVPTIETIDDFIEFMITTALSVDVTGVAIFQYELLYMLKFGGKVFDMLGWNSLRNVIRTAGSYLDYSYEDLCDDCPPAATATDWWMIYHDFRNGASGWQITFGTLDQNGILSANNGGTCRSTARLNDLGGDFLIRAAAVRTQRRGSEGNGTSDTAGCWAFSAVNGTGTQRTIFNTGFITCNENQCENGAVLASNSAACRSLFPIVNLSGPPVTNTNFVRITEVVYYGACNAGHVKPPMAVYVPSVPAVGDLFPT